MIEKICSFYANNFHLSLILLEYLKNKDENVISFFEDSIFYEANMISKQYGYGVNTIIFKKKDNIFDVKIDKDNTIIIIKGSNEYINKVNQYIIDDIIINRLENVQIINCYQCSNKDSCMSRVLRNYRKILYTNGLKTNTTY